MKMNRKKQLINEIADLIVNRMLNEEMTAEMDARKKASDHLYDYLWKLSGMIEQVTIEQVEYWKELTDSMSSFEPKVTYDNYEEIAEEMANTANGFLSLPILNYRPEDPDREASSKNIDVYSYAPWSERKRFGDEMQQSYYNEMKKILLELIEDPSADVDELGLLVNLSRLESMYTKFIRKILMEIKDIKDRLPQ